MRKAISSFSIIAVLVLGAISSTSCAGIDEYDFFLEGNNLRPGTVYKSGEFLTLDDRSWNVDCTFQTRFTKRNTYEGNLVDSIELQASITWPDAPNRKRSYIKYTFEVKETDTGYNIKIDSFHTNIEDDSLPLGEYLFSLDETSQEDEVINIARQVLDLI